jgi:hypothetical protein
MCYSAAHSAGSAHHCVLRVGFASSVLIRVRLKGRGFMGHRRRYARDLLSRVKQIITLKGDRPSEVAFNVVYWGAISACLYIYILQYTVTLARDNIHAD